MSAVVENYPGELAMLSGLVATLRAVAQHGDLADVQKLLAEHERDERDAYEQAEKSSPPRADATPLATRDRRQILLGRIRAEGGEWTTHRTQRTYRGLGITGVLRSAVRADLVALHAGGHLVLHEDPARRFYTYCAKGGA